MLSKIWLDTREQRSGDTLRPIHFLLIFNASYFQPWPSQNGNGWRIAFGTLDLYGGTQIPHGPASFDQYVQAERSAARKFKRQFTDPRMPLLKQGVGVMIIYGRAILLGSKRKFIVHRSRQPWRAGKTLSYLFVIV